MKKKERRHGSSFAKASEDRRRRYQIFLVSTSFTC
jgi:hypothetical protein